MYCRRHAVEYSGLVCPVCDVRAGLDSVTSEVAAGSDRLADELRLASEAQVRATAAGAERIALETRRAADSVAGSMNSSSERIIAATQASTAAMRDTGDRFERQLAEVASAIRTSVRDSLEGQLHVARDAWKLQAQSRIERGLELLGAGLADEAATMLREALSVDPGNLEGHVAMSLCSAVKGQSAESQSHAQKAMMLLGTKAYSEPQHYALVLTALSDEAAEEHRSVEQRLASAASARSIAQMTDDALGILLRVNRGAVVAGLALRAARQEIGNNETSRLAMLRALRWLYRASANDVAARPMLASALNGFSKWDEQYMRALVEYYVTTLRRKDRQTADDLKRGGFDDCLRDTYLEKKKSRGGLPAPSEYGPAIAAFLRLARREPAVETPADISTHPVAPDPVPTPGVRHDIDPESSAKPWWRRLFSG